MKIESSFCRIARNAGGLFLGLRLHFPVSVVGDFVPVRWTNVTGYVGLLFWEWRVAVNYGFENDL